MTDDKLLKACQKLLETVKHWSEYPEYFIEFENAVEKAQATKPIKLPERKRIPRRDPNGTESFYVSGFNESLDEVKRLNGVSDD